MIIDDEWMFEFEFDPSVKPETTKPKSMKDKTIEHAMEQVRETLSGKHARGILGAIEQQIRYAYKQGYEIGLLENKFSEERYNAGYKDGMNHQKDRLKEILEERYNAGYNKGYEEGDKSTLVWRNTSYMKEARQEGYDAGFEAGQKAGYSVGYNEGRNNLREELKEVIFHEDK